MFFDVNFIIVDNDQNMVNSICDDINKVMINNDTSYNVFKYYDYDNSFLEIMEKKLPNKIYILDIECDSASGIDIARKIRKKDLNSIIIFVTSHKELADIVISDTLLVLTYITKFDNMHNRLKKAIKLALKKIGCANSIRIFYSNYTVDILVDDIVYIEKEIGTKNCIIYTEYNDFKTVKNISYFKNILDNSFIKINRSLIVNNNYIVLIDKTNKIIKLKNKSEILY